MLITGHTGFIGGALSKKLNLTPVSVNSLPRIHADYFFHFGSPSSQILFAEDDQCIRETIEDFIKVVEYCKRRHLKLIFPSSSTVYTKINSYAHTKSALEEIVQAYDIPYLALRIFAGYGPGEGHKKHYSSVIYQWVKQMMAGERPVIFGDGSQSRDFVFIDDIVKTIIENMDQEGAIDIGTGVSTSFIRIIEVINNQLGTDIEPVFLLPGQVGFWRHSQDMKSQRELNRLNKMFCGVLFKIGELQVRDRPIQSTPNYVTTLIVGLKRFKMILIIKNLLTWKNRIILLH